MSTNSIICGQLVEEPTIQRIDSFVARFFDEAVRVHPKNVLLQDRWLRDRIIEDTPPDEAAAVAIQCDHYLLCLRVNSQTTFS
jgi:hypothetical protein